MSPKKRWLVIATRYDPEYLRTADLTNATLQILLKSGFIPLLALLDPEKLGKEVVGALTNGKEETVHLENLTFERLVELSEAFDVSKGVPPGVELTGIRRFLFRGKMIETSASPSTN